jgi:hypothetical protein
MAEIEIRFRMNMESGKKDIFIDYHGDEDAMRHEHERDHGSIVRQLIGDGVLTEDEVGEIQVERGSPGQLERKPETESAGPEAEATGAGG